LGIRRRTLSATKTVSVLSRMQMQVHYHSPTESKPQSHGSRSPANLALSTASTRSPPLEESRDPNCIYIAQIRQDESNAHLNTPITGRAAPSEKAGCYSTRRIQGVTGIQDGISTADTTAGKEGERECSSTRSGARVAAHIGRPSSGLLEESAGTRRERWSAEPTS
jgi:hypothetical protein